MASYETFYRVLRDENERLQDYTMFRCSFRSFRTLHEEIPRLVSPQRPAAVIDRFIGVESSVTAAEKRDETRLYCTRWPSVLYPSKVGMRDDLEPCPSFRRFLQDHHAQQNAPFRSSCGFGSPKNYIYGCRCTEAPYAPDDGCTIANLPSSDVVKIFFFAAIKFLTRIYAEGETATLWYGQWKRPKNKDSSCDSGPFPARVCHDGGAIPARIW
jgi:hypothetical protein